MRTVYVAAIPVRRGSIIAPFLAAALFAASAAWAQSLEDALDEIAREVADTADMESLEAATAATHSASAVDLEQALLDAGESFALSLNVDDFAAHASVPKRIGGSKVAGRLLRLAESRSKSLSDMRDQAKGLGIPFDDDLASVSLFANDESDAARLRREVERRGGEVEAVFENVVMARLPVNDIAAVGEADALYFMDVSPTFQPLAAGYGRRVSEGVSITKADALQAAGVTGKGVKVGILDFGFERYSALVRAGEVPRAKAQRAFNRSGRVEADMVHGTGCAEIIADMAPDAELYLAAVNGAAGQIIAAGQWLASQGVDIINFSGGGHYGPHNGSALLDRFVDHMVRERGVLWVNAAGNEGASHWTGMAVDRNRNGLVDSVDRRLPDLIALSGEQFQIMVIWDDWGSDPRRPSSRQDLDAYLLANSARGLVPVAASREIQNGRGVPAEVVVARGVPRGQTLYLALHLKSVSRPVRVHVFATGARNTNRPRPVEMVPLVPSHSVGIPATSRGALSVGAVDVRTNRIEEFSSRGPTDDRRMKPDVVAPDNTISLAYVRDDGSPGRFTGTSAAAPHVAGFAALLKQRNPSASTRDIRQAVLSQVRPRGRRIPNTDYGHGQIVAAEAVPRPPPRSDDADEPGDDDLERALRDILGGAG